MVLAAFSRRNEEQEWTQLHEIVNDTGLNEYVVQGIIYKLRASGYLCNRTEDSPKWQSTQEGDERVENEKNDLVKRVQLNVP